MTEPTCRTCYAATLTSDERERFFAEQPTMPMHFCAKHKKAAEALDHLPTNIEYRLMSGRDVVWRGSVTGRMPRDPEAQFPRFTDYSTGSTHPNCVGDSDICPDNGCKACQGEDYDNGIRGRISR